MEGENPDIFSCSAPVGKNPKLSIFTYKKRYAWPINKNEKPNEAFIPYHIEIPEN